MAGMIATVEIDKLGRLVVPKQAREALHLQPGDKLELRVCEESLILQSVRSPRGLYEEDGLLVFDGGGGPDTTEIPELIRELRQRRADYEAGLRKEP